MTTKKATEAASKSLLLEAAHSGRTVVTKEKDITAAVAGLIEVRKAKAALEAEEKEIRAKVESYLLSHAASYVETPQGAVAAIAREREGIDKKLIPADILAAAKTLTEYVELRIV